MALYKVDSDTADLIKVAGGTLYADNPIGSILPFGGTVIPSGWLSCSGQAISRTEYADLYSVIGTYYGSGNGTTTFNVPDLREATPKGTGLSGKSSSHYSTGGVTLGQFIDDRIQGHWHDVDIRTEGGSNTYCADMTLQNYNSNNLFTSKTREVATNLISDGTNGTPRAGNTTEVKSVGVNFIIKAKHTPVPADFTDSLIGYLGQETNYNLYPWSHVRTEDGADTYENITVERDGWYSIDYTLTNSSDTNHTFTLRDTDSQGNVHTIMRAYYDKSGTFRQTYLVPLKAGTYIYSHGGTGTLSVYMNRRDFAN